MQTKSRICKYKFFCLQSSRAASIVTATLIISLGFAMAGLLAFFIFRQCRSRSCKRSLTRSEKARKLADKAVAEVQRRNNQSNNQSSQENSSVAGDKKYSVLAGLSKMLRPKQRYDSTEHRTDSGYYETHIGQFHHEEDFEWQLGSINPTTPFPPFRQTISGGSRQSFSGFSWANTSDVDEFEFASDTSDRESA